MGNIYNILNVISITLVCVSLLWGAYVISKALNMGQEVEKKSKQCSK